MYEKILVPLDGSKVGEAALPFVEGLVTKFSPGTIVEVTLIQVVSSLSHYIVAGEASAQIPYTQQEMEQIKKRSEEYLDGAAERLKEKGITVNIRVTIGAADEEITKAAEEIDADLIAMSTHGRSGISRWAFGSVTNKVLKSGKKPVLMIRAPKETSHPKS